MIFRGGFILVVGFLPCVLCHGSSCGYRASCSASGSECYVMRCDRFLIFPCEEHRCNYSSNKFSPFLRLQHPAFIFCRSCCSIFQPCSFGFIIVVVSLSVSVLTASFQLVESISVEMHRQSFIQWCYVYLRRLCSLIQILRILLVRECWWLTNFLYRA